MPSWIASFRWKARIRCSLSRRSKRGTYSNCMVCWLPAQEATVKATKVKDIVQLKHKTQMNTACPCLAFRSVCNPVTQARSEFLLEGKGEEETLTCFADLNVVIFLSESRQPSEFVPVGKWLSKSYRKWRGKWEEKNIMLQENLLTGKVSFIAE